eukprot:g2438.t1
MASNLIMDLATRKPAIINLPDHHTLLQDKVHDPQTSTNDVPVTISLPPQTPVRIEFRDVCFTYPSRPNVSILNSCTFTIEEGKITALVGKSGGGKSTITNLIQRFYETDTSYNTNHPDKSSSGIFINGTHIKSIDIHSLRSRIAIVQQDPVLFHTTIFENITMGRYQVLHNDDGSIDHSSCSYQITSIDVNTIVDEDTEHNNDAHSTSSSYKSQSVSPSSELLREAVIRAAKRANAHTFITSLQDGYETIVGTSSSCLSGGQRQRISIARALFREPTVLILDEATSNLDSNSELSVQTAIEEIVNDHSNDMTVIVIAHRLSTIKNADHIIVMEKGNAVEQGTHNDLLEINEGIYRSLVQGQTGIIPSSSNETHCNQISNFSGNHAPSYMSLDTFQSGIPINNIVNSILFIIAGNNFDTTTTATDMFSNDGVESMYSLISFRESQQCEQQKTLDDQDMLAKGKPRGQQRLSKINLKLWKVAEPCWPYLLSGGFVALFGGGIPVLTGMLIVQSFQSLSEINEDPAVMAQNSFFWISFVPVVAVAESICTILKYSFFAFAAERTIKSVRLRLFHAIMKQEIAFFDSIDNASVYFQNMLSKDSVVIGRATSQRIGGYSGLTGGLTVIIVFGLYFNWQLALLNFALLPFLLLAFGDRFQSTVNQQVRGDLGLSSTDNIAESLKKLTTVKAYQLENQRYGLYCKSLALELRSFQSMIWSDILKLLSVNMTNFVYSLMIYIAGIIIS